MSASKTALLRWLLVLVSVSIGIGIAWYSNGQPIHGTDDANIYMVYMRNLAEGHGFVYNVGGERVEGFTSLLWTIIGAALYGLSGQLFHYLLLLLNFTIIVFSLYHISKLIDFSLGKKDTVSMASVFPLVILVLTPGYFDWTVLSLLETGLWSSQIILSVVLIIRINWFSKTVSHELAFVGLSSSMIVTRPEAMLWVPFLFALRLLKGIIIDGVSIKNGLVLMVGLCYPMAMLAALTFWRIDYFGYPLPNTFYAKVSSDLVSNAQDGFRYLYDCFKLYPHLPSILLGLFLILPQVLLSGGKKAGLGGVIFLVSCCALLIPVLVGGDCFGYARFLQPVMPVMLASVPLLLKRIGFEAVVMAVTIITLAQSPTLFARVKYGESKIKQQWAIAEGSRGEAERTRAFFSDLHVKPSIGVLSAGGFAWSYDGEVLDLLGLNNVEMAHRSPVKNPGVLKNHASFNFDVFMMQSPDIVRISWIDKFDCKNPNEADLRWLNAGLLKLDKEPRFQENYKWSCIQKTGHERVIVGYMRKGFLESLPTHYVVSEKYLD